MLSCNLDEIVTNVLLPFVEHCTRRSDEDGGLEGLASHKPAWATSCPNLPGN